LNYKIISYKFTPVHRLVMLLVLGKS